MSYRKVMIFILLFVINLQAKELFFLNQQEKNYLQNLQKPIKIGITQIPNQVLITKNGYTGFSIDLFNYLEKKLNIKFQYVYFKTWNDVINAAKNKKIDVVFLAQKTPSRLAYLDFTDTVLVQQNKIIVNINNDNFHNLKQLKGKKVAITNGSAIEEYLKYNYPQIKLIATKNSLESLKLLNQQKVDATILESVRASYYIKKYNLSNLAISDSLNYNYFLSIATINTQPMLNVILTKTLEHSTKEIKALTLKWGYDKDKIVFFDAKTLIFIGIVFAILIVFIFYVIAMNKKLKREIKEKNEALKRVKQMRDSRLNQMSEIMSMIAHQWKQPLNVLSMIHQIVIMNYKDNELDDETMQYFEVHAKEQIDLMIQTINDFRDFFKINEEKKSFYVENVIDDSLKSLKPVFKEYNIAVNLRILNEEYKAIGYPNALNQIIINILNNAKDALIENNIKNKEINISLRKDDKFVIINIEDNAGGIPIEIIDKIFMPYFSTKEKTGTGLGLYMAEIIIEEKMNGSIDVRNSDKGADFEIKIPLG